MKTLLCGLFISCLALPAIAQAQHPTLTTEDVIKWRLAHPELAENYIPRNATEAAPPRKSSTDEQFLADEKHWNHRLTEARARVKEFERRAAQTEIEATQARNVFMHADASSLNANNARIAELRALAAGYQAEARTAQEAVNRLLDEGKQAGYQLNYISPRTKTGEPNLEYYRTRFLALQSELQAARARAEVFQLRTNRLNTSINSTLNWQPGLNYHDRGILFYPNTGASDVYYRNRLRNELGGLSGDLNATLTRISVLTQLIEELQEEGRRAGVPPGVFR